MNSILVLMAVGIIAVLVGGLLLPIGPNGQTLIPGPFSPQAIVSDVVVVCDLALYQPILGASYIDDARCTVSVSNWRSIPLQSIFLPQIVVPEQGDFSLELRSILIAEPVGGSVIRGPYSRTLQGGYNLGSSRFTETFPIPAVPEGNWNILLKSNFGFTDKKFLTIQSPAPGVRIADEQSYPITIVLLDVGLILGVPGI